MSHQPEFEWCEPDECPAYVCGGPHISAEVPEIGTVIGRPDAVQEFADIMEGLGSGVYDKMVERQPGHDPVVPEPKSGSAG